MSKTLIVKYTPREGSNTAKIVDAFTDSSRAEVVIRDLSQGRSPLLGAKEMKTWWGEAADNKLERASSEYIAELKEADHIVIATPMYNWGLPATVKAWFDAVIRGGKTFEFKEDGPKGLLKASSATIIVTTGMITLGSEADQLTTNVKQMLGIMGVTEGNIIAAENLMMSTKEEAEAAVEGAIAKAKEHAKTI